MAARGRRVLVGCIVGVHGVHGAMKIESFTDPRLAIFDYNPWLLERGAKQYEEITGARGHAQGKGLVAMLAGVDDRDAAAARIGARIWIPREALPELAGEYYQADLEGLQVINTAGDDLGRVSHLVATGGNAVMATRDAAGRERLIPYVVDAYVKKVDLDAGTITVDWDKDD